MLNWLVWTREDYNPNSPLATKLCTCCAYVYNTSNFYCNVNFHTSFENVDIGSKSIQHRRKNEEKHPMQN